MARASHRAASAKAKAGATYLNISTTCIFLRAYACGSSARACGAIVLASCGGKARAAVAHVLARARFAVIVAGDIVRAYAAVPNLAARAGVAHGGDAIQAIAVKSAIAIRLAARAALVDIASPAASAVIAGAWRDRGISRAVAAGAVRVAASAVGSLQIVVGARGYRAFAFTNRLPDGGQIGLRVGIPRIGVKDEDFIFVADAVSIPIVLGHALVRIDV